MAKQLLHKPVKGAVAYCWHHCEELTRRQVISKGCYDGAKQCENQTGRCKWIQPYAHEQERAV
jgi:hypothetical protein